MADVACMIHARRRASRSTHAHPKLVTYRTEGSESSRYTTSDHTAQTATNAAATVRVFIECRPPRSSSGSPTCAEACGSHELHGSCPLPTAPAWGHPVGAQDRSGEEAGGTCCARSIYARKRAGMQTASRSIACVGWLRPAVQLAQQSAQPARNTYRKNATKATARTAPTIVSTRMEVFTETWVTRSVPAAVPEATAASSATPAS